MKNEIGDDGAQHLANALQQNNVTSLPSHIISHSFLFPTDTCHIAPQKESDRSPRSTTSWQCSATKQCSIPALPSDPSLFLFYIDTHHTGPHEQQDRFARSTTTYQCSETKQRNTSIFSSYV